MRKRSKQITFTCVDFAGWIKSFGNVFIPSNATRSLDGALWMKPRKKWEKILNFPSSKAEISTLPAL